MFGIMIDEMDWNYSTFLDDDMFFVWIIWTAINAMIIKKIFFSENFIQERLEVFADWLAEILALKKNSKNTVKTDPNIALTDATQVITEAVEEPIQESTEKVTTHSEINSNDYEDEEDTVVVKPEKISEPSAFEMYMKKFFSENILAKIGSILVFLWVVFLMSLIWNQIPDTLKVIIGFAIGFWTYFVWVKLDKKWYVWESRILLWTWILINFLVILAAKYILNFGLFNLDPVEMWFIATGITLLFLVLNTIFWVITSLVYNSRTLLVFSFIFAYINPFLTGGSMDTPYTLAGYSIVVSLWALYVGLKQNDNFLKYSAFIGWNILLLLAPFQSEIWWITLLVSSALLWLLTILSFTKSDVSKIPMIFIGNYIFIILLLISGWDNNILSATSSFISYMLSILFFFGIWIWLFLKELILSITSVLIFPILIILGLIFTWTVTFIVPALATLVLVYLVWFNNIQSSLSPVLKYVFFWLLWGFIFMVNSFFSFNSIDLTLSSFITVILITFVFLFTSYYLSTKKKSEFLYSIWTLGSIFMLMPILVQFQNVWLVKFDTYKIDLLYSMETISIIAILLFALANIILPFVNKQLTQQWANIKNLLTWSIFGILFIGFQLFNYGSIYFPGVSLGLAFWILAILYFILSSIMMNKLWIENVKKEITEKNIVLSYLFISISLFSVAIALVFSNTPEIISTVWLFEATILFYFFNKTQENKIWVLGLVLFIIWVLQLFDLSASKWEYLFLIPLALIAISFVFNLKYLDSKSGVLKNTHDVFHILWIGMMSVLLLDIIPSTGHGWSMLAIAVGISILSVIYAKFSSNILKIFFIIIFALFAFGQYEDLSRILRNIDRDELSYLRILQYATYMIMWAIVYLWNKINLKTFYNKFINIIFILYSLAIVSYFVYDMFSTTFAITIFWWLIASLFLFYWINVEKMKMRTSGLYLLSLVLWKIFIYDIWDLDDAVTRVIALMIIWVLLIIISIQYTSKYWNNLIWEFNIKNLFSEKQEEKIEKNDDMPLVNKHIEHIDVSDIDCVKFSPINGKNFTSKAKNLKKIVKLVLDEKPCGTFQPNELLDTYNYILSHYETELTKRDFEMINGVIKDFVSTGWAVEIKK